MTPTQRLHDLLTRLRAVPEDLNWDDDLNCWADPNGDWVWPDYALAILRDAASELIESHGLNTTPGTEKMWRIVRPQGGWMPDTLAERDTRAEALIAGLEWIIKQKGRSNANP